MERQVVGKPQKGTLRGNPCKSKSAPSSSSGRPLLVLQRAIGNHAMQGLINSPYLQTKLQISTPGDPFEQEADRTAETVMRMAEPEETEKKEKRVQSSPIATRITRAVQRESPSPLQEEEEKPAATFVQRVCTQCQGEKEGGPGSNRVTVQRMAAGEHSAVGDELEEQPLQAKADQVQKPTVTSSVAANIDALHSSGSPLPQTTRAFFEPRFGVDLSHVRVHTDSGAATTANAIHARAFTIGRHIAFGGGQYVPHSYAGRHLLAHELTHVVQQEPRDVIHRRPTADEVKEQKRDAWLKELGNYPPEAHQEWKHLTNMEKMAVVVQMTKRYGYDFAKSFLSYTKRPIKSSIQHFGPGFPEHTPDWFQARGYRLWQRSSFNEFWVHPSGSMIMQILDQKRSPRTAESPAPRETPSDSDDCAAMADAALSILRDTLSTETSVKEDLEGSKGRLEKMDKTTDDYCRQFDEYIQSLEAMKSRVDTTVDDIETMRQPLVEQKCNVSTIDGLLQDLEDLQIWSDIESSPMSTQFLKCIKTRGPQEFTEEDD